MRAIIPRLGLQRWRSVPLCTHASGYVRRASWKDPISRFSGTRLH